MKKWVLYIVFLCPAFYASGQKKEMKKSTPAPASKSVYKDEVEGSLEEAKGAAASSPGTAADYVKQALQKSIETNDKNGEAKAYQTLGLIYYKQKVYLQAIANYSKALQLFKNLKNETEAYNTENSLAEAYEANNNTNDAIRHYLALLNYPSVVNNDQVKSDIYVKCGDLSLKDQKLKEANQYYLKALNIEEVRKNEKGIASINNKLGTIYLNDEKPQQALEYYSKSQSIARKIDDKKELAESYENIGNAYRKEKKLDKELEVRKQSIEINKSNNDREALTNDYLAVGENLVQQNKPEEAIPYLEKTVNISNELGKLEKKKEAHLSLSEAYSKKGDYDKAIAEYKNYVSTIEALYKEKEAELDKVMASTQELSLKQKQIETLEKDNQLLKKDQTLKDFIILGLIFLLVVIFVASFLLYRSVQKRRIANQLLALKSLRSQMNPHFIFNALNSVNSFISKNDERSANKYLADFSRLMRAVMENSNYDFVPLSSELKIIELYLTLEHFRFKEKFDYVFNIDEEIATETLEIPPMVIQPYIENAVWHGLRYKEEKGLLKVEIRQNEKDILITIEDDGIGRKKSEALKTDNQKEKVSTGMKNTEARFKIVNELFKTNLRLKIGDLDVAKQTGTKVEIRITPKKSTSTL